MIPCTLNRMRIAAASLHPRIRLSSSLVPAFPSNLWLTDSSVLTPEKPAIIKPEEYNFPIFNLPTATPVKIFNKPGQFAENIDINPRVFGVAIRKDIVHDVIRYHRAKLRQPRKTKRKSEIRGSNKKPHPQKGSGRAQAGHRRNSIWRGGQKAHGPVLERDFSFSLNRKVRALGMMIALAAKHREGNLIVFDEFTAEVIQKIRIT